MVAGRATTRVHADAEHAGAGAAEAARRAHAHPPCTAWAGVSFFLLLLNQLHGATRPRRRRPRMFSDIRQLSELFTLQKPEMGTEYGFYQARLSLPPRACALRPRVLVYRVVLHLRRCSPRHRHRLQAIPSGAGAGARVLLVWAVRYTIKHTAESTSQATTTPSGWTQDIEPHILPTKNAGAPGVRVCVSMHSCCVLEILCALLPFLTRA